MISLWSVRGMEDVYGFTGFLMRTLVMVLLSKIFYLAIMAPFARSSQLVLQRQASRLTMGFSGVIFGWMAMQSLIPGMKPYKFPAGMVLQPSVAPVFSLLLTQILVPNVSFVGHFTGILAGYLVGFGACDWVFKPYWMNCVLQWLGLLAIASLKATTQLQVPFVDYSSIRNGVSPDVFSTVPLNV